MIAQRHLTDRELAERLYDSPWERGLRLVKATMLQDMARHELRAWLCEQLVTRDEKAPESGVRLVNRAVR